MINTDPIKLLVYREKKEAGLISKFVCRSDIPVGRFVGKFVGGDVDNKLHIIPSPIYPTGQFPQRGGWPIWF